MKRLSQSLGSALLFAVLLCPRASRADEGMWLHDAPPTDVLKEKYGFVPTEEWLDHIHKSCVKMGASGSFISPHGLILTNHHVGSGQLEKLSTPDRDLIKDGFIAHSQAEELECPDMEVMVLWEHSDVTDRIQSAVTPGMTVADAETARRKRMTEVEDEAQRRTGLKSQVVKLYRGARYELYGYRSFNDVRLVFAPEQETAFFGGDNDNFEYPRFDLDVCFFRVYENGKPLEVENYLKVAPGGAKEGDLAFVFGHPGRTNRLCTVSHLRFRRDVEMPYGLNSLCRREVQLATFMARSPENARTAGGDFFGIQNGRKARTGYSAALEDPAIMKEKTDAENDLRAWVAADPERQKSWGGAWDDVASAYNAYRGFYVRQQVLDGRVGGGSDLFGIARTLVRLAAELPKPSPERLREYRETNLESLYLDLYSPAPIYAPLEVNRLASWLTAMQENLGGDDPLVISVLAGMTPAARAEQVVTGSKLADIRVRKALAAGGAAAIEKSDDAMIRLAALLDPDSRAVRKLYEDEVDGVETAAYAKIAAAQFAHLGTKLYPDATGTLRMAFGPIEGYRENGRKIPPFATFAGMFQRYRERKGQPGFELPSRWLEHEKELDAVTPINFICTADIIGGNSGSPVVNRDGELIGLIFDGNIQSLAWDVAYSDREGRAIAVDVRGILEALRVVYGDAALADEIEGGR